jgi:hypothetical protein
MELLNALFGHDYAYLVVGLFFLAAVGDLLFYHRWIMPQANKLAQQGSPEGQKALARLGVPLYLGAICCAAIGAVGLVYHASL